MTRTLLATAALATVFAVQPAAAATSGNMLKNGSFENGFADWTVGGTQGDNVPVRLFRYDTATDDTYGEKIAADNAAGNPGFDKVGDLGVLFSSDYAGPQTLSQLVTVEKGKSYTFGFDLYKTLKGADNKYDARFTAMIDGFTFADYTASGLPTGQWMTYAAANTFTADSTGTFAFNFYTDGYPAKDFAIDRVYLAETSQLGAVPEPATWAMMLLGFGLVGGVVRSRRSSATLVAA